MERSEIQKTRKKRGGSGRKREVAGDRKGIGSGGLGRGNEGGGGDQR